MELLFRAVAEDQPGDKWRDLFAEHWPASRHWFLSEGIEERALVLVIVVGVGAGQGERLRR